MARNSPTYGRETVLEISKKSNRNKASVFQINPTNFELFMRKVVAPVVTTNSCVQTGLQTQGLNFLKQSEEWFFFSELNVTSLLIEMVMQR